MARACRTSPAHRATPDPTFGTREAEYAAAAAALAAASAVFSDVRIAPTIDVVIWFWNEEYIPPMNGAVSGPDTWPPAGTSPGAPPAVIRCSPR